jgi:UDPglucose 6-dehydrogenase
VKKIVIGVIGHGFVGGAVVKGFELFADLRVYDIVPEKATNTFKETANSDFVFICVPTPMTSPEGGDANLNIIYKVFEELAPIAQANKSIYVIKSTIPIGTTAQLSQQYHIQRLLHNPEFLREKNAIEDFFHPSRNVIGGEDKESIERLQALLTTRFPNVPCHVMPSGEAELVKYISNAFLATKLSFFNEMRLLIDVLNLDWNKVVNAVIADKRIGKSHYQVPGPDGEKGWGGVCLPKDVNALIATMKKNNLEPIILEAIWKQNKQVRKNWDWAKRPSAVSPPK